MLAVLIAAYILAFVDRQILGILVQPLERDLHISDTEVSLLQGLNFAGFLALSGLPIGRLVDTKRRVTVAAAGIAAWSLATAASAFAQSYNTLLVCRSFVAIGEAALTPAAHSMIADSFPRRRLGLALGVFGIGSYIGSGSALLIGPAIMAIQQKGPLVLPLIGSMRPWQSVFLVIGLPGLAIAAWMATLREPPRDRAHAANPTLGEAWRYFWTEGRSILLLNVSAAFTAMATYAMGAWIPTFLVRSFGWTTLEAGGAYGSIVIACGIAGTIAGGAAGDFAVARGLAAGRPIIMALASLCAAPCAFAAMLAPNGSFSAAMLLPTAFLSSMSLGILPSAQQAIVPGHLRGVTASLGVLMVNLIGLGCGPTVVGVITDFVLHDPMRLRYSLAVALPAMFAVSAMCGPLVSAVYRRA
jgi:MFS family permease